MKARFSFVSRVGSVLSLLCLLFFATQARAQTSYSYPPFPTSSANGLQVNGTATIVSPEGASNFLQLTAAANNQVGSAWYTNPAGQDAPAATLSLANGFSTIFSFQFTNPGTTCCAPGADGIAYVAQNGGFAGYRGDNTSGALAVGPNDGLGGEIGFTGLTNSVAVQLDTFYNSEYGDTPAAAGSPTSADQVTVESCGTAANTVNHNAGCQFGTVDLSRLPKPIYIGDGNVHNMQLSYAAPSVAGTCPVGSALGAAGCGSLTIIIDGQTVLSVPFNLGIISGYTDPTQSAFTGFTGATGGSYQNQDVITYNFIAGQTAVVTNPINTSTPPVISSTYNSQQGSFLQSVLNYSTSNGLTGGVPSPTLLSTNNQINPVNTWPQYVAGTPWATSSCTVKAGNGPAGLCSQIINVCYDAAQGPSGPDGASDGNCPSDATPQNADDFITLEDVFDWFAGGKIQPANGTTFSFIDFSPTAADPAWNASQSSPNPSCTNVSGSEGNVAPTACDFVDKLVDVFGDQTTQRSTSKPKGSTFVTASGVPEPLTGTIVKSGLNCAYPHSPLNDINVNDVLNYENPNFAQNIWNNGNCLLDFVVNPASTSNPTNGYLAAPPASFFYGLGTAVPVPGSIPSGDNPLNNNQPYLNPNPVFSNCNNQNGVACPWDVGLNQTLTSVFGGDGTYTLHWSGRDTAGITEKNVTLYQNGVNGSGTCPNPSYDPNNPNNGPQTFNAPCYSTAYYYSSSVNIDSNSPTGSCSAGPAGWVQPNVTLICSAADDRSGIYSSNGSTTPGLPVNGTAPVSFNLATTVALGTETSMAYTGSQQFCDWATNCTTVGPYGPFQVDMKAPVITVKVPTPGQQFQAYASVSSNVLCTDGGSGVKSCNGTAESGGSSVTVTAPLNTKPNGPGITNYIFTAGAGNNTYDEVGNITTPSVSVNYSVSCHYASVLLNSTTLTKGISFDPASTMITDCEPTAQKVVIELTLTGLFGKPCAISTQLLFLPIPLTIPANTNKSPLPGVILFVPGNACSGPGFTFSTNTYSTSGALLDSVSQAVTVK